MRTSNVFFVGTSAEVEHHIRPVADQLKVQIVDADKVVSASKAGDVALFFSEHFDRFRQAITQLKAKNVATIYMIDGILEWRNAWENRSDEVACPFTMRPVLAHKVACIGENQARVLSGWGNDGKVEIIGVPRFDRYLGEAETDAQKDAQKDSQTEAETEAEVSPEKHRRFRLLVMTAKTPAFTDAQWETVRQTIVDCKTYADANADSVEVLWRLTGGLDEHAGVKNSASDLTGMQLHDQLKHVDAVLSTPSTAVVEALLAGKPTALLNYFQCPSYLNLAWNVNHVSQVAPVIQQLRQPEARKLHFQNQQLQQILYRQSSAADRLVALVRAVQDLAVEQVTSGEELNFPPNMLPMPVGSPISFNSEAMFPTTKEFTETDLVETQAQLAHARRHVDHLNRRVRELEAELKQAHQIFDQIHDHPIAGPIVRIRERVLAAIKNFKPQTHTDSST